MDDVAERAGVSRSLVSLVMRSADGVSPKRRAKVQAAAEELGYRPNLLARNLAGNRTNTIGLLLDDLHNPFYADSADGVWREATELGYRVIMSAGFRDPKTEQEAIETFLEFQVEGMILASPRCESGHIRAAGSISPTVVLGDNVGIDGVSSIANDDTAGSALAVGHLVTLGHRSIVHITGGGRPSATVRQDGYATAMTSHGLSNEIRLMPGEFTERTGVEAANALVAQGELPTAIFAGNDLIAAGCIGRLAELGIDVPNDISVVGYDNTGFSALGHLSITTINQPRAEMGRLAMSIINDSIDQNIEPEEITLKPDLVVRSTTAAPRGPAQ